MRGVEAALWVGRRVVGPRGTAMAVDGLFEEELDLPVHAPQILLGPGFQGLEKVRIDPQQERLA